uniref:Uncharacterized protein n=1 Tax=Acrobeloides nanus TaxID=290746 RepID=A0A914DLF3_9BILA
MFSGLNLLYDQEETYQNDSTSSSCLSNSASTISINANNNSTKELIEALEEDDESPLLTAIPYVVSFFMVILVLWGGAYVFQLIDEVAAEKPLYNVMFYTLQVVCIIVYRLGFESRFEFKVVQIP